MDTENTPTVSMLIGGVHVAWMSLSMMILHDITPEGFVQKEKKKWGEVFSLQIWIGGMKSNLKVIEDLYRMVLIQAKKDHFYVDERTQRKRLTQEIGETSEGLRSFIELV